MPMDFDFGNIQPEFKHDLAGPKAYTGPERRLHQRRRAEDRRDVMRFEPGKCIDRREQGERRARA